MDVVWGHGWKSLMGVPLVHYLVYGFGVKVGKKDRWGFKKGCSLWKTSWCMGVFGIKNLNGYVDTSCIYLLVFFHEM